MTILRKTINPRTKNAVIEISQDWGRSWNLTPWRKEETAREWLTGMLDGEVRDRELCTQAF